MWLIHTTDLRLVQIHDIQNCRYAILSHTWEKEGEVDFQEMRAQSRPASLLAKPGFLKIKRTCEVAKDRGYDYAWVDTCCIDKESSAALSEAINSMFKWYKESSICLAYLSDLPANNFEHAESRTAVTMASCKWFTRGWTLQELIAPEELDFYDEQWMFRGSKKTLRHELSRITGIDVDVLGDSELLPTIPVGRRMSWAARRKTERVEDIAYCLFGIFSVNMPMIYGEDKNAFLRLQEEIAKSTNDLTLFAWTQQDRSGEDRRPTHQSHHEINLRGILAHSPAEFVNCGRLKISRDRVAPVRDFAMTNNGLRIEATLGSTPDKEYVFALDCVKEGPRRQKRLGIYLMKTETGFVRDRASELFETDQKTFWSGQRGTIYIARSLNATQARRLQSQQYMSFNFYFHLSPHHKYKVTKPQASPSDLWDENSKLFLTGNRKEFTGMIDFTIRPRYWRFVIVCGLIDIMSQSPRVTDLWGSPTEGVVPWMAIFTDADPAQRPQLEIIDRLKNDSGELWRLRESVLSWNLDDHGRLPLRKMAEKVRTAFDDDGEMSYNMTMIMDANRNGNLVFNLRVFISDTIRVRDISDPEPEDAAPEVPQMAPRWVPQPPPANAAPVANPFESQPRRPFVQAFGPGPPPAPWRMQYANPVPPGAPGPAYLRPGHAPPRQRMDPAGYYAPGFEYGHNGWGRPL